MQQASQVFEPTSIPEPVRVFSKVTEEVQPNAIRFELDQVDREETLRLVQRIFLQQTQNPPRTVLFAAVSPGAGCSQVCLLVAEALRANVKGTVCLVEADFRSPALPSRLGTTNHYGLSDALLKDGPIRSFAKPVHADNLWFLSSGSVTPDTPNLLNSDRMKARFDELRKEFDYVLVDVPSLSRYSDATAVARITDGIVLVLEANATRKEAALKIIESLRNAQVPVLGAVLNKRTFPIPASLYDKL